MSIYQVFIAILGSILAFRAGKDTKNITMVTHIKGDVFVSIKTSSVIFQVLSIDFCNFFEYLKSLTRQSNERKNLAGHRVCLGDIAQNITKMGVFSDFPRGAWREFYKG